ncbi:MAG: hypothetical protein EHM55_23245 [Acidobacteria bacterium]|nr:MAG: hypothetical protein EHM55_23245 [Acidobacteriota bacterium]
MQLMETRAGDARESETADGSTGHHHDAGATAMTLSPAAEIIVPVDGRDMVVVLRRPRYEEIAPFTAEPLALSQTLRASALRLALRADIATVDGEPMRLATADRLAAAPDALAHIIEARNLLYEQGRAAGEAWAVCPHCDRGEVKLSLLSFATRFGALPPDITAADPLYLLPPSLSLEHRAGARPAGSPLTRAIRFRLPSASIEPPVRGRLQVGVLNTIDASREAALSKKFAPHGKEQPDDRVWWRRGNPCFRALVALAAATTRVDDGAPPKLADLAALLAVDVYFLDALYHLSHFADLARHAPADTCPACGRSFYPVF